MQKLPADTAGGDTRSALRSPIPPPALTLTHQEVGDGQVEEEVVPLGAEAPVHHERQDDQSVAQHRGQHQQPNERRQQRRGGAGEGPRALPVRRAGTARCPRDGGLVEPRRALAHGSRRAAGPPLPRAPLCSWRRPGGRREGPGGRLAQRGRRQCIANVVHRRLLVASRRALCLLFDGSRPAPHLRVLPLSLRVPVVTFAENSRW